MQLQIRIDFFYIGLVCYKTWEKIILSQIQQTTIFPYTFAYNYLCTSGTFSSILLLKTLRQRNTSLETKNVAITAQKIGEVTCVNTRLLENVFVQIMNCVIELIGQNLEFENQVHWRVHG